MILEQIIEHKKAEIELAKSQLPIEQLQALISRRKFAPRAFAKALSSGQACAPAIIAEVKKISPSLGLLNEAFSLANLVSNYSDNGATCLSILTDQKFFGGHLSDLKAARALTDLPLLRKDFIIDEYQINQSKLAGADAILLIVNCLEEAVLANFMAIANDLAMEVIIEVHDQAELSLANRLKPTMIGVNNRNLKTMKIDLKQSLKLFSSISKEAIAICESGISNLHDLKQAIEAGYHHFLIGSSLVKSQDPGKLLKSFTSDIL